MSPTSTGPVLAGRDAELAVLDGCLDQARAGRPHVVVVEGEPGMGKSALIAAFLRSHPEIDHVQRVRGDRFEQQVAFGVAGLILGRWPTEISEVEVGRQLLSWFGDTQSGTGAVTVLVVDDAQWLDRPSAQAIRLALRRLRVDAVLTVVARRPPAESDPWWDLSEREDSVSVVRLGPLAATEVRQLARGTRAWDLPLSAADDLVARTGGLPLLVQAVLREAATPDELTSGVIPASAAAAAHRMLASVDEEARHLVEAAAVLAQPSDLVALGQVAALTDPTAASAAARAAGLLTADLAERLECAHALLRDAVYQVIPLRRRQQLHRRAIDWTGSDRQLAHRVAAAEEPDQQLLHDLVEAADTAVAADQFQLAATHRLQARAFAADVLQRDELLLRALINRIDAQDLPGAEGLAVTARQLSPGPMRSLALGLLARERGEVSEATTLLADAMAQAVAGGEPVQVARAGIAAARLHVALNRGPEAVSAASLALRVSDATLAGDATTLHGVGQWQSGDLDGALASLAAVRTSAGGLSWEVDLLAARGMVRSYAGQLESALSDLDAALALSHLWRPGSNRPRSYAQRSMVRYYLGDWDGATVDAAAARAVAEGLSQPWGMPLAQAVSVHVPGNRGQWDVAADHLARARSGSARAPSTQVTGLITAGDALIATAQEDYAKVLAILTPVLSGEPLRSLTRVRSFRWIFTGWINAALEVGRLGQAQEALTQYETMLDRWPGGPIPSRVGFLRARLAEAHGDATAAQRHYADDLADPTLARHPFIHAQVLHASGRLERALGNRRAAIDRLLHAQRIFAALRAAPFLGRCTADLAAVGMRADRADPLTLTEREEDVAALVTRGLTNKEVGAELYLTAKTVEYHLRNIYTKLGIASRRELRQLRAP